ncbi:MAG: hypothetical protein IKN43_02895 [Selenomonadaceae bacterium]|nr:hypothetical protein [Selenomonadaceae bacterium]
MKFIIWGAGVLGRQCLNGIRYQGKENIEICAFIDNNPSLIGTTIADIPILEPKSVEFISFDKVIICSQFSYEHIKRQLIEDLKISEEKILCFLMDPLPIRIDVDADNTYLGMLGEFGAEMIAWIPYLSFLKSRGLKLKTFSRKGSSVYYENISDEHIEVENRYFASTGYGYLKNAEELKKDIGLPIFCPCKELRGFKILINGIEWEIRNFHSEYKTSHLLKPSFPKQEILHIKKRAENYKGIVTINNKSYQNTHIGKVRNHLTKEEVELLFSFLTKNDYYVVYNDFSETFKEAYDNVFDSYLPPKHFARDNPSVLFLSDYSDGTEDKWDRMQLECWQNSDFVIQHPGGAAAVVELLGIRKFNFMQKGEYQDDLFLSKLYGGQSDTFYEIRHMIAYIEKEMREGRL